MGGVALDSMIEEGLLQKCFVKRPQSSKALRVSFQVSRPAWLGIGTRARRPQNGWNLLPSKLA